MVSKNSTICCGCLDSGRKMVKVVNELEKKCFSQIINEKSVFQLADEPVTLCWLCVAQLGRFTKFKEQVQYSYRVFKDYVKQNRKPDLVELKTKPSLKFHKVLQLSIDTTNESLNKLSSNYYEVKDELAVDIKTEDTKILNEGRNEFLNEDHSPIVNDDNNHILNEDSIDVLNEDMETTKQHTDKQDEFCETNELYEYKDAITSDEKIETIHTVNSKKKKKKELCVTVFLSREEVLQERKLAQLEDNYVNAMFRCEKCIVSFANADDLKDHVSLKHNLHSLQECEYCGCTFGTLVAYHNHTKRHTRRYQCTVCTERCTTNRDIMKHYENVHGSVLDLNAEWLKGKFLDETTDSKCNGRIRTKQMYGCEFCSKTFIWKTSLRKHAEKHRIENGQKRKPYCEPCQYVTEGLQYPIAIGWTGDGQNLKFTRWKLKQGPPSDADAHAQLEQIKVSVLDKRRLFECPYCDKTFQWRGNRARHMRTHSARVKGDLVCSPCNRTFSSVATYKQHMETSKKHVTENDLKYMCSHCGKKFATKTRIRDHINWEHLKKFTHACAVCQKVFKTHTSLYIHNQAHHKKDTTEHLCHHCGKAFPSHAKLNLHIRSAHQKNGPFNCEVCGAKFSWASCLSRHVNRVHKKPPPT